MSEKISQFAELLSEDVTNSDLLAIVNADETKKITFENLFKNAFDGIKNFFSYDYNTNKNITINDEVYAEINRLQTDVLPTGTYESKFSINFSYDSINRAAYFRWSLDAGASWDEYRVEPKDVDDVRAMSYILPIEHTESSKDIKIEARCENDADTLQINSISIIFERKI